nr:hypothetical protein [Delftia acidovorans]
MDTEIFRHDASIKRLRELVTQNTLRDRVTELFIASLATGVRRAMTPLMAYYSASQLPAHDWERFDYAAHNRYYAQETEVPCAVCGILHTDKISRNDQISDFANAGRCATEPSHSHLIDLEDVTNIRLEYQPAHVQVLRLLLTTIDSIDPATSTTELLKQISQAKILRGSNNASRLWCLRILAQLGVVTNASIPEYTGAFHFHGFLQRIKMQEDAFSGMSHRADPVWPLSAGRGTPPVNWALAHRLFPQLNRH